MASRYLIASDATYKNVVLPDNVITELGLPLTVLDENDVEQPHAWTIETALPASPVSRAGPAFPIVVQDPEPPLRDFEGPNTDWVCPVNNLGGNIDLVIMGLSAAAQVPYVTVSLSPRQLHTYFKTGALPV